jgi:AcrR family transcriptional regulator
VTIVETPRAYDAGARRLRAERILDVAAEQLQRWGYKRLTMDDVASEAGIGKGTIYLHWKTREALFEAVLWREIERSVALLVAAVHEDPTNALPHRLARFYFTTVMQRPLLRAFFTLDVEMLGRLVNEEAVRSTRLNPLRQDYVRLLLDLGVIRSDFSQQDASYVFRTLIVGFFLADPLFKDESTDLQHRADLLEKVLKSAMGIVEDPPPEAVRSIAQHVEALFGAVGEMAPPE